MMPRKILKAKKSNNLAKTLEYQRKQQLYKDFYNLQYDIKSKGENNEKVYSNDDKDIRNTSDEKSNNNTDSDSDNADVDSDICNTTDDDNVNDIFRHVNQNQETLMQNLEVLQRFVTTQIKIPNDSTPELQFTKDEILHEFPYMAPLLKNGIFETLSAKKPSRLFVSIHRRKTTSRYILNIAKIFQLHQLEYVALDSLSFTKLISTQQQQSQYDHSGVVFIHIMLVYVLYALFCNKFKIFGVIECENAFAGQQLRQQIKIHYPMLSQIIESYIYFM
ncbi:uncharacterized protein LOC122502948 [Leptopilina heterotoma]|uniref:uncharacterized protein LOC122502948 n=1 Tax=Leptopilina heterotoma TaxID=63436 RepID=UPI001CA891CE|nr:uncharacterized protein LOC122502948 [Leptopilina heterotoma]XP_043469243.1 uncharacterized protein LOC122502948 [Leptopilina heterotoma]